MPLLVQERNDNRNDRNLSVVPFHSSELLSYPPVSSLVGQDHTVFLRYARKEPEQGIREFGKGPEKGDVKFLLCWLLCKLL